MKLERLPYDPTALVNFYEEGFAALGALCERTWHNRLDIVAEGHPATLWNADGALHEIELEFAPADATTARDASREVFPGCPLTFHLAEALRPTPLPIERVVLAGEAHDRAPDLGVAEKLWRAQYPQTTRFRPAAPFKPDFHYSLVVLLRCDIQAIDQHWSLRRLALALPGGEPDDDLAENLTFAQADPEPPEGLAWPRLDLGHWSTLIRTALEADLAPDLASIRQRQEAYLKRELDRVDDYFENYEAELTARARRSSSENAKLKTADRLGAAKAEHARRRADQVARHEIRVRPHIDALLLVAEPAWRLSLQVDLDRQTQDREAAFVPRARKWFVQSGG